MSQEQWPFCAPKKKQASENIFAPPLNFNSFFFGFLEKGDNLFSHPVRTQKAQIFFVGLLGCTPYNPLLPEILISGPNYKHLRKTENSFRDFFSVQKQCIHGGPLNTQKPRKNPKHVPYLPEILGLIRGKLDINDEKSDDLSQNKMTEEDFVNKDSFEKLVKWIEMINFPMREYPIAKTDSFPFFFLPEKNSESKNFKKVILEVRTTGGNCRKMVEKRLQLFFEECGVPSSFQWEKGAWTLGEQKPIKKNTFGSIGNDSGSLSEIGGSFSSSKKNELDDGEERRPGSLNQTEESSSVKESNISLEGHEARPILEFGTMGERQEHSKQGEEFGGTSTPLSPSLSLSPSSSPPPLTIEEVVKKFDKVLEAIGFFPWIEDDYEAYKKRVEEALRVFEKDGWTISQATLKIWEGERDLKILVKGIDGGSIQLVKSILFHTRRFDLSHGKKKLNSGEVTI